MARTLTTAGACAVLLIAGAIAGRAVSVSNRLVDTKTVRLSGDEVVYLLLGDRLWHEGRYTTQGIEHVLPLQHRIVPEYLDTAVFKHPPLYPALVGLSRSAAGGTLQASFYPNLLLAAVSLTGLLILTRALGVSPAFSVAAGALLAVSPVHWIASSRIWLDLPMTTFMALALALQFRGMDGGRWWPSGALWVAAVLTKMVAVVPWMASAAALLISCPSARRSRTFWISQMAVAIAAASWFMLLAISEGVDGLASRNSRIDDARTLLRIAPLFVIAGLACGPIVWWWRRRATAGTSLLDRPLLLVMLIPAGMLVGSVAPALLSRPWTGWDANLLAEYGALFYLVYPILFDPLVVLGFVGLFVIRDGGRALPVRAAWLALIVFLTCWGNFQTRYSLPLLPIELAFAAWLASDIWRHPQSTALTRTALLGCLTLSCARSLWVAHQLRAHDFFYF